MRHSLVILVTVVAIVLLGPAAHAVPQTPGASTTTSAQADTEPPVGVAEVDQPVGGIIPRPNSGATPEDAGERGGPQQWFLLATIVLFFLVASVSIYRTSKRVQQTRAASQAGPVS